MKKLILILLTGLLMSCGVTLPETRTYYVQERPVPHVIYTNPPYTYKPRTYIVPPMSRWEPRRGYLPPNNHDYRHRRSR